MTLVSGVNADRHVPVGPFLYLAVGAAFVSLLCCLYVVRPKLRDHPGVSDYVSPAVALSSKSRFHIALSLAEDYNQSILEVARLRRYDPVAWSGAQASIALAAFAILAHLLLYLNAPTAPPSMVSCKGRSGAIRGGLAWKASCQEGTRAR